MPKTSVVRNKSRKDGKFENDDDHIDSSFKGDGITLTPLEPMRKWRIQFHGQLRNSVKNLKFICIISIFDVKF